MINVLKSWEEVIESIVYLQRLGCGYHGEPLKNWDLAQIGKLCTCYPKTSGMLDVGCGESRCTVLKFLYMLGYRNIKGVDLRISLEDRAEQFLFMRRKGLLKPPFRLVKADITKSGLKEATFDFIICLSTIEHGVDVNLFMKEISRLLRPGGTMYLSTDYWPSKIETGSVRPWGLDWRIFSNEDVVSLIKTAQRYGLEVEDSTIPSAESPLVNWSGKNYTFISITFEKSK